jgi:hypothetical protein
LWRFPFSLRPPERLSYPERLARQAKAVLQRVGIGFNWDKSWFESSTGRLTGYWDAGYTYWEAGDASGGAHSLSFAPVFVYEFGSGNVKPFIEAGIGLAVFSRYSAGDQDFGSAFNFEDRIGALEDWRDAEGWHPSDSLLQRWH